MREQINPYQCLIIRQLTFAVFYRPIFRTLGTNGLELENVVDF